MSRTRLLAGGFPWAWRSALASALVWAAGMRSLESRGDLAAPSWQDSMLAGVQEIERWMPRDCFEPYVSGVQRGGDPARKVSVSVAGAKELYLFASGIPDVKRGVADWAEARVVGAGGSAIYLKPGTNTEVLLGRCETDLTLRSGLYQKLRLGQRVFDRGLNVQANSILRVGLRSDSERFEAWIGVDAWAGTNGTVRFSVLGSRAAARQQLYLKLAREYTDGRAREQMRWEQEDGIFQHDWDPDDYGELARRYAEACYRVPPLRREALGVAKGASGVAEMRAVRERWLRSRELDSAAAGARQFDFEALRLAVADLANTFPREYPAEHGQWVAQLEGALAAALVNISKSGVPGSVADYERVKEVFGQIQSAQREALLANPLLGFERLLLVKRKPIGDARRSSWESFGYGEYLGVPRQSSWNYGTMPNVDRWTNEIAELSPVRPAGKLRTVYKPAGRRLVNDIDLHWDADKFLFSMPDTNRNWQVNELRFSGTGGQVAGVRQLTPSVHRDVHNYNGIYLPSGEIIFLSTAALQGVPCNSGVIVGMMYKMEGDGGHIHQLTFEQDHDYTPSVMNDGRVLYLRWDYTDTPHVWNRLLMSMNPDGTVQSEYYGANSYWPNAIFFARAIPNQDTKVVGIVTGHHEGRVGELFIFDPAKGRHEISGVVQRIPRHGPPVEAKIEDKLTEHSWPKFLQPWPLSDKYFLVACKPDPDALWGIYLVDVFDNRVLLKEEEGFALLDPVPVMKRPVPPVIPDRTQPERKDALVYIEDIYSGPGLKGVPRGAVKALRIFTYHFGYQKVAGIDHRVGADGPWEVKRVLGTVRVESDGSAFFRVPAQMPLSFQPLDSEGKAMALMRSWMTAMPGENVSCVGCHEQKNAAPPASGHRLALGRAPDEIAPWRGEPRGFSFVREVQPVLDRFCVGCHDGSPGSGGKVLPDLRRDQGGFVVYPSGKIDGKLIRGAKREELLGKYGAVFDPSYVVLRQYVRVGGLESDLHQLPPMEFHSDTSELIQMLAKGHHHVRLDAEGWERLVTWIDLNAPCHGTWSEVTKIPGKNQCERRLELRRLYGGVVDNYEVVPDREAPLPAPIIPEEERNTSERPGGTADDTAAEHSKREVWRKVLKESKGGAAAVPAKRTVDLGGGIRLELVRIPAGEFVMGDPDGTPDEQPAGLVRMDQPFWMGACEISNEQFARFDRAHDSRFEHRTSWIFSEKYLGWPLNGPKQPVVRVSWKEAMDFCGWLSEKLGERVTLPTEAQWEYACRAGTASPMFYGGVTDDFSKFGNMGDINLRRLADEGWRPKAPDLIAREARFNDGALVTCDIGSYQPNGWGLHDMHGNAAEWTRSVYLPYPYRDDDGRNGMMSGERRVVRGGSWRDRPKNCRAGFRWAYSPWHKVFNVGFRIVIEEKSVAARE